MNKLKNVLLNLRNYFADRITPLILLLIIVLFLFGEYISVSKKSLIKANQVVCEEKCLPNASEVIKSTTYECWCYMDNKTLIKKGE
jgi:hypothetical protein